MVMWMAGAGAALCLAYYGIIVCYSGFSTSFAWFWLLAGVCLLGVLAWGICSRLHPRTCPLWLSVGAATCFGASVVILCVVELLVFLGASSSDMPNLDYVIVLGAKVEEGRVSSSLRKRLDKAIEYSRSNPDTVLILSGGQGRDEPASEAWMMREYLKAGGIPEGQLLLEEQSFSTVENMAYSKALIDRLEEEKKQTAASGLDKAPGPYLVAEDKPVQVGVVTSSFHVFRAVQIGKKRGFTELYGISAPSDPVLFLHLCVRECAAVLKDKLMGHL